MPNDINPTICHDSVINGGTGSGPSLTFIWYSIVRMLDAFFKNDPNVVVTADEAEPTPTYTATLTAINPCIATALATVLNTTYILGNITGTVKVMSGGQEYKSAYQTGATVNLDDLLKWAQVAFAGNMRVKACTKLTTPPPFGHTTVYVVAEKAAIQYFDDSLTDLYQSITQTTQDVLTTLLSVDMQDKLQLLATTVHDPDTNWGIGN